MKRFLRILFNAATVLSLLLCAGTVALWIRGNWFDDHVSAAWDVRKSYGEVNGASYRNGFAVGLIHYDRRPEDTLVDRSGPMVRLKWEPERNRRGGWGTIFVTQNLKWQSAGFAWISEPAISRLIFPAWCPAMVFGLLPAVVVVRGRWLRSVRAGLCPACGYDLRATPDRCPECGAIPTTEEKTAAQQPGAAALQKR